MIEIKFSGDNFDQLRSQIQEFAVAHLHAKFGDLSLSEGKVSETVSGPHVHQTFEMNAVSFESAPKEMPITDVKERKRRGPKPGFKRGKSMTTPKDVEQIREAMSEKPVATPEVKKDIPVEMPKVTLVPPTMDQVTLALQKVWDKHGMDTCLACLGQFGAKRARDLKPEDFQAFIDYCEDKAK